MAAVYNSCPSHNPERYNHDHGIMYTKGYASSVLDEALNEVDKVEKRCKG
jgi:hypothetical protein